MQSINPEKIDREKEIVRRTNPSRKPAKTNKIKIMRTKKRRKSHLHYRRNCISHKREYLVYIQLYNNNNNNEFIQLDNNDNKKEKMLQIE